MYCCQDTGEEVASLALKPHLRHSPLFFVHLVVILSQADVPLPTYGQKHCFAAFETGFTASPFFSEHFGVILRQTDLLLPENGRKPCFACFETNFTAFLVFFEYFGGYYTSIRRTIAKIQEKIVASAGAETCFTAFAVTFWALCGYFVSNRRIVLRHFPLIFEHFGDCFAPI